MSGTSGGPLDWLTGKPPSPQEQGVNAGLGALGNTAQSFLPQYEWLKQMGMLQSGDLYADHNLANQGYNLQSSFLGANEQNALGLLGLDRQQLGLDRNRLGLSRQGLDVDAAEAHRRAGTAIRGINQDFTARGAWFAPEKGAQVGDTYAARDADLNRIDLSRQGIGLDEQGIGLKEQGVGLREQGVGLDFDQRAAQIGLDRQQATMLLDRRLRDLSIDQSIKGQQLIDGIAQGGKLTAVYEWILKNLMPEMF
jgi:hypothetical protein